MTPGSPSKRPSFVVAAPFRTVCDHFARLFQKHGILRLYAVGTRRPTAGISPEWTRLLPLFGLLSYAAAKTVPPFYAESFRFRLHPMLDHWVKQKLQPGDHILSSYAYANKSFQWVRRHGGKTFLDGGNSHPENFWEILVEEHRRWNCPYPPVARHYHKRCLAMMEDVDYVLASSSYVANSFLSRGFSPDRVLRNIYPVDLSCFTPRTTPRPKDQPLRIINTGGVMLRKGTPYLLEAFRIILKQEPSARLMLTSGIAESMRHILPRYSDLPIDWSPGLPHPQLAERLRSADIFVLPSLEEGLARTSLEAMACGLPVVVTPNTGSNDLVTEGVNGSVVPIRDPQAIAEAVLFWWQKIQDGTYASGSFDANLLSTASFEATLERQLDALHLLPS
ncbi:MAG: glycosyltransferase family 4 protein [Verrucomicrobia bacterium]|nr:glycosyltransferase family 4 protein [Verrucomicrobiota bacterium]